ncbi:uncharacterized protein LY89DRAFT_580057 [Mollisia scopiformis]|uniref:Hemerythrin-like domain-containing protein n=1 Tax=Mollisia scopiformis TaxID=149040 RepID=A0A194XJD9_MOLSC|nr:uncharacterized protein LY89DRAFT_580057 [Mollisia scopiformis]KUJ19877.1 hypothetical protein LY89DRAFT_580057 [Mollisia scopiformis]
MADPPSTEAEILKQPNDQEPLCDKTSSSSSSSAPPPEERKEEQPKLPKLSAADFRTYNSMAEHMEYFHNHFRQTWTLLHTACTTNTRPRNLSLRQFLQTGLQFISHLETHHSIEEAHIFPVLARKMPEFKNKAELLRQHQEIHKGMESMGEYLERVRDGECELELRVLKERMDGWGEVLWRHLDEEVKTLGAENMRRYWTVEEMRRMPM